MNLGMNIFSSVENLSNEEFILFVEIKLDFTGMRTYIGDGLPEMVHLLDMIHDFK